MHMCIPSIVLNSLSQKNLRGGGVRWPGRAAHFCLPPFPTWAISNYNHFQLQPFPTTTISNYSHFQLQPFPTTAISNYSHFQLQPFPTTAISNYSHFQLQPFPTIAISNLDHFQLGNLDLSNLFGHFQLVWPFPYAHMQRPLTSEASSLIQDGFL